MPFLISMLPVAMKLKENIIVHGIVSEIGMENMKHAIALFAKWNIGLSPIEVFADQVVQDKNPTHSQVASFFSAGVDSFYTYLMHKSDINCFVLVHGFDIELQNKSFFNEVQETVKKVAKKEKKRMSIW